MEVELRYLQAGEYPVAARFLHEFWAPNHAYVRMPALFDWAFGPRPEWDHDSYSFAIARQAGEDIGILGGTPFVFNNHGRQSHGVWLANWMVREGFRGGTTAMRLLRQFTRPPYDPTIAFGINPAVARFYALLGGKLIADIPRHFMVLPEASGRMLKLLGAAYPDWEDTRARALVHCFEVMADNPNPPAGGGIPDWPAWARTWQTLSISMVGAARSADYLLWRYIHHPCFEYRFISALETEGVGILVWRLEKIHFTLPDGSTGEDYLGRVVEFLPASRRNGFHLLSLLTQALREEGAMGADFYGYHAPFGAWMSEWGFHRVTDHPDGCHLPARFQPLVSGGGQLRSAVFSEIQAPSYPSSPGEEWYWTKSDSDQDRPN